MRAKDLEGAGRDTDMVGVVCFGPSVQIVAPPVEKGNGGSALERALALFQPQAAGGTCFFDAVATCVQLLTQQGLHSPMAQRWLVCLTDGDDLGSRPQNARGQFVDHLLNNSCPALMNMVMITVGQLEPQNVRIIDGWVRQVAKKGGVGQHLAQSSAAAIAKAIEVVAEHLAVELDGATEC